MTPTTEVTVAIELDKERTMRFNGNAMAAYEKATGKFYLDTVAALYDVMKPMIETRIAVAVNEERAKNGEPVAEVPVVTGLELMRKVSMTELRALLWSSIHDYDKRDEPVWPLTIGQVGRLIRPGNVVRIFLAFLTGQMNNSPTKAEMGESPAVAPSAAPAPQIEAGAGGEPGIELPVGAFS